MASLKQLVKRLPIFPILMVYIFFASGIIITVFLLLAQVLWLLNKTLYRYVSSYLALLLYGLMVWVCVDWADVQITLFSEQDIFHSFDNPHSCLMTFSHRGDFDWLIAIIAAFQHNFMHTMRTLPKKSVMYIPGFGQLLWALECPFLSRSWEKDEAKIKKALKVFASYPFPIQVTLFCEGTRFTEEKYQQSVEYAKKNGLQPLKYHLMPRTKGYAILADSLKREACFETSFDLGFAYPFGQECYNGRAWTLMDLMVGNTIKAYMYCRKIPMSELPTTIEDLQSFCHGLYQRKDQLYQYFLDNGTYPGQSKPLVLSKKQLWALRLNTVFWSSLTFFLPFSWLMRLAMTNFAWLGLGAAILLLAFICTNALLAYTTMAQKKTK